MTVQNIAVIGAGTAGRAFALRAVAAGFAVALEDVMPENLRRAQDAYAELGGGAGTIRYAMTVEEAVQDADLAIDFVPDELESKLEIFSLLDRMAPPRTILCTPTEVLSITDLASCTYRAERCVGLRGEMELVRSRFLGGEVEAAVVAAWVRMGVGLRAVEDVEPELVKNLRWFTPCLRSET